MWLRKFFEAQLAGLQTGVLYLGIHSILSHGH